MTKVILDKVTLDYCCSLAAGQDDALTVLLGVWRVVLPPGVWESSVEVRPWEYQIPRAQAVEILESGKYSCGGLALVWLNSGPASA